MDNYCSICSKKLVGLFIDVEDKNYCDECFDEIEDTVICCEECSEYEHKNENSNEKFVELKQDNGKVLYYHKKCLPEYFSCPICNEYLYKEGEECLEMFISYDLQIEHHKRCVENKKNNKYDLDICKDCNISFLRKCNYCDHRFNDCYNKNCKAYYYENNDEDIDVYNNYTGFCSRKCNNRYHM